MPPAVNPVSIFLPMLVVVALTFAAFGRMAAMRRAALKAGHDPRYYRAYLGESEPEATVVAARHYSNVLELPVLFYAADLTAYVLGAVSNWTLIFAWGFTAARLVQSGIHLSYNNPAHRGLAYVLSMICLLALWIALGLAVLARL